MPGQMPVAVPGLLHRGIRLPCHYRVLVDELDLQPGPDEGVDDIAQRPLPFVGRVLRAVPGVGVVRATPREDRRFSTVEIRVADDERVTSFVIEDVDERVKRGLFLQERSLLTDYSVLDSKGT